MLLYSTKREKKKEKKKEKAHCFPQKGEQNIRTHPTAIINLCEFPPKRPRFLSCPLFLFQFPFLLVIITHIVSRYRNRTVKMLLTLFHDVIALVNGSVTFRAFPVLIYPPLNGSTLGLVAQFPVKRLAGA